MAQALGYVLSASQRSSRMSFFDVVFLYFCCGTARATINSQSVRVTVTTTTATRSDALPYIPSVREFLPSYEASAFIGIGAPKNTPAEIVSILNKQINAGLADLKIKARFAELGGAPLVVLPADFGKLIAEETKPRRECAAYSSHVQQGVR
jgi:tripartite-type tricarboxylate transporter receptor subunit TctC